MLHIIVNDPASVLSVCERHSVSPQNQVGGHDWAKETLYPALKNRRW